MTVDLTDDELLLIHQAVKEYYFDLLSDQFNYDIDTSDEQKKYSDLDNKLKNILNKTRNRKKMKAVATVDTLIKALEQTKEKSRGREGTPKDLGNLAIVIKCKGKRYNITDVNGVECTLTNHHSFNQKVVFIEMETEDEPLN